MMRDYQLEAIAASRNSEWQRHLIVLPTGMGKTFTGLGCVREQNEKTLWLAHREELITQARDTANAVWPEARAGIVKAEQNQYMRQLVIASIQTAQVDRRMQQLLAQGFRRVVVDEAHHALSEGYQELLYQLGCFSDGGPTLLGLTATPERTDHRALDEVFQGIVYQVSIYEAIARGFLVNPTIIERAINVDLDALTVARGDFGQKQLDLALMQAGIVGEISAAYTEHCLDRKTIVFVVSVAQAEAVAAALRACGVRAASVSGETPSAERRSILRRLKTGEITCVVNCMVLTEGFDEPSVDAIILARPTQSKPLMIQCVGRGLRLHPGKESCRVIDMVGLSKRNSLVQAAVLFGLRPDDMAQQVTGGGNLQFNNEEFWRKRLESQINGVEAAPRSALRWVSNGEGGYLLDAGLYGAVRMLPAGELWQVDAVGIKMGDHKRLMLARDYVDQETAQAIAEDYVRRVNAINRAKSDAEWRKGEANQKQMKFLKSAGVKVDGALTKGTAADLELQARAKQAVTPATSAQLYFLRKNGIAIPKSCTKREAHALIVKAQYRKKSQ